MRSFVIPCLTLVATALAGCSDPAAGVSSEPATVALRVPYELYGVPGPWWRDNASQTDFDHDMWACRTESKEARAEATSETRKDVAYRAFLECMTRFAWTRGYPPSASDSAG